MRQPSNPQQLDAMIEFAIEEAAYDDVARINGIPRKLVTQWPNEVALSAPFAMTTAAAEIDRFLRGGGEQTPLVYKLSAVLSADVFAVQTIKKRLIYASDILTYWQTIDPYLLKI